LYQLNLNVPVNKDSFIHVYHPANPNSKNISVVGSYTYLFISNSEGVLLPFEISSSDKKDEFDIQNSSVSPHSSVVVKLIFGDKPIRTVTCGKSQINITKVSENPYIQKESNISRLHVYNKSYVYGCLVKSNGNSRMDWFKTQNLDPNKYIALVTENECLEVFQTFKLKSSTMYDVLVLDPEKGFIKIHHDQEKKTGLLLCNVFKEKEEFYSEFAQKKNCKITEENLKKVIDEFNSCHSKLPHLIFGIITNSVNVLLPQNKPIVGMTFKEIELISNGGNDFLLCLFRALIDEMKRSKKSISDIVTNIAQAVTNRKNWTLSNPPELTKNEGIMKGYEFLWFSVNLLQAIIFPSTLTWDEKLRYQDELKVIPHPPEGSIFLGEKQDQIKQSIEGKHCEKIGILGKEFVDASKVEQLISDVDSLPAPSFPDFT
jgi:hypothetical protein